MASLLFVSSYPMVLSLSFIFLLKKMGFFVGYKILIFRVIDEKNGYFLLGIKFRFFMVLDEKKNRCFLCWV